MNQRLQTAFPLGEVRPGLHGRVDTELYQSALSLCRDALPLDGFRNRCGLELFPLEDEHVTSNVLAVIPFVASTGEPYHLWFYPAEGTDFLRFRVLFQGEWVVSAAPPAVVDVPVATQSGFPAITETGGHVRYSQVADEIYIAFPGVETFRIRRLFHNQWDTQITPIGEIDPLLPRQSDPSLALKITGRQLTTGPDSERIPLRLQINRVYRGVEFNGPFVDSAASTVFRVPYLYDDDQNKWGYVWNLLVDGSPSDRWTQIGATGAYYYNLNLDLVLGAAGPTQIYNLFQLSAPPGILEPSSLVRLATQAAVETTANSWTWGVVAGITTIIVNVNNDHPVNQFSPLPPEYVAHIGYCVTLPNQSYKIYMGLGANANQTDTVGFVTERSLPFIEFIVDGPVINYADVPYDDERPFNQQGGFTVKDFPLALAITQQRLWVGGLDTTRNAIHASRLGELDKFGFNTPPLADDALDLTIASERVDQIRHLLPHQQGLLVFTNGDVWRMTSQTGALSFDTIGFFRLANARCSNDVQPLVLDDRVIFVDETNRVLELVYDDQSNAWQTVDRSFLSNHLFKDKRIISWGWQANPGRVLWAVQDDGTVLACVISPDFQLWGWSQHTFADGRAKFVNIVPSEEGVDETWFVVSVGDPGHVVWCRLQHHGDNEEWTSTNSVFLDYYLHFSFEDPQTVVTIPEEAAEGIPWLEHEVTVIADGQVIEGVIPEQDSEDDWILDLSPFPPGHLTSPAYPPGSGYHEITIGLPYHSIVRTLPITDAPDRKKRLAQLALRLRLTQGLQAGPELDKMEEMKSRTYEAYDTANELTTGTVILQLRDKWMRDGQVYFRQGRPMPMAVESIVPTYEKGEG